MNGENFNLLIFRRRKDAMPHWYLIWLQQKAFNSRKKSLTLTTCNLLKQNRRDFPIYGECIVSLGKRSVAQVRMFRMKNRCSSNYYEAV